MAGESRHLCKLKDPQLRLTMLQQNWAHTYYLRLLINGNTLARAWSETVQSCQIWKGGVGMAQLWFFVCGSCVRLGYGLLYLLLNKSKQAIHFLLPDCWRLVSSRQYHRLWDLYFAKRSLGARGLGGAGTHCLGARRRSGRPGLAVLRRAGSHHPQVGRGLLLCHRDFWWLSWVSTLSL